MVRIDQLTEQAQRLRVFVSSTLGELAVERWAVTRAITALPLTPVLFEAGARPHPPWELYQAYLAQSDVFIGLNWQRYGQVNADMEVWAGGGVPGVRDRGLPRLLYVKTPVTWAVLRWPIATGGRLVR